MRALSAVTSGWGWGPNRTKRKTAVSRCPVLLSPVLSAPDGFERFSWVFRARLSARVLITKQSSRSSSAECVTQQAGAGIAALRPLPRVDVRAAQISQLNYSVGAPPPTACLRTLGALTTFGASRRPAGAALRCVSWLGAKPKRKSERASATEPRERSAICLSAFHRRRIARVSE